MSIKKNRPSASELNRRCEAWNKVRPVGTEVIVTRDNGEELRTKTRSEAWLLSGHSAVIQLEGVSGCYALDRVRPAT